MNTSEPRNFDQSQWPAYTGEFSICLEPTPDVVVDMETIRAQMAESPYRDDQPHVTLLKGISTAEDLSDEELARRVGSVVPIEEQLPVAARFKTIITGSNAHYSDSSLLMFAPTREYSALRRGVVRGLESNGFSVDRRSKISALFPHLTARLGVPLEGELFKQTNELFKGRTVEFGSWFLYRVFYEDGKRLVRTVLPDGTTKS